MEIEKKFRIIGITGLYLSNASLRITLINLENGQGEETPSVLTMDKQTAMHRGLPYSIDEVGELLTCIITAIPYEGYLQAKTDVLFIESLSKEERVTPYYTTDPPVRHTRTIHTLTLATSSVHPHNLPCPDYHLTLALQKEEYRECKKLLPQMIFKVAFKP
ncbi:MAG: hypothetical protein AAB630_03145 [Patescibacteria group bacterium]